MKKILLFFPIQPHFISFPIIKEEIADGIMRISSGDFLILVFKRYLRIISDNLNLQKYANYAILSVVAICVH